MSVLCLDILFFRSSCLYVVCLYELCQYVLPSGVILSSLSNQWTDKSMTMNQSCCLTSVYQVLIRNVRKRRWVKRRSLHPGKFWLAGWISLSWSNWVLSWLYWRREDLCLFSNLVSQQNWELSITSFPVELKFQFLTFPQPLITVVCLWWKRHSLSLSRSDAVGWWTGYHQSPSVNVSCNLQYLILLDSFQSNTWQPEVHIKSK